MESKVFIFPFVGGAVITLELSLSLKQLQVLSSTWGASSPPAQTAIASLAEQAAWASLWSCISYQQEFLLPFLLPGLAWKSTGKNSLVLPQCIVDSPAGIKFCRSSASSSEVFSVVDRLFSFAVFLSTPHPPPKIKAKHTPTRLLTCWHIWWNN